MLASRELVSVDLSRFVLLVRFDDTNLLGLPAAMHRAEVFDGLLLRLLMIVA